MYYTASCIPAPYRFALRQSIFLAIMLALIALALQFALPGTAHADPQPEVQVEVMPASLNIPDTGQVEVQVVITNLLSSPLQNVRLSWFTNAGVKVTNTLLPLPTLVPAGQYVWTVQIASSGNGSLPGPIQFRIDYSRQVQGQVGSVDRVAFGTLMVQSEVVIQPIAVQVLTSLVSLDEQHSGFMYLQITNNSDYTVTLEPFITRETTPYKPDFIQLDPEKNLDKQTIPPHQQRTIQVKVSAANTVQTGKQTLVFEIPFQWNGHQGNVVASQQIDVGVLGESQLLTLLGLPSLLLLPGFLVLITLRILRPWIEHKKPDELNPKLTTPEFWFWAIIISILVGLLYPYVSKIFLTMSRNYLGLGPYGLLDIVYVWIGSVALTTVAYLLWFGITQFYKWIWLKDYTLSENDLPVDVLRKLERRHYDIARPYVTVKFDGDEKRAFLLEPYDANKDELWASPAIVVRLHNGNDSTPINTALKQGDIHSLVDILSQKNDETQTIEWRTIKEYETPFKVKKENIVNKLHKQFLVEVELDAKRG